jgi:prepilin-type N-terminal cleavage/methylation domain-containing protein
MLRRRVPARARPAFTLLEMLLAAAIGVLLMSAVYVAFDYQLNHIKAGREVLEQSLLARSVLTRMGNEIKLTVCFSTAAVSAANSSSSSGAASPASTSGSSTSATPAASGSGTGTSSTTTGVVYNQVLQGDSEHVVFVLSRVPKELLQVAADASADQIPTGISDLRQVTYWMSANGLAYRETMGITSSDAVAAWTSVADDPSAVVATEVQSLNLRYFDGTTWQDSWNATTLGPDGKTPVGPPVAVEIKIGVQPPNPPAGGDAAPPLKYYTHRVTIPVANGTAASTTTSSP